MLASTQQDQLAVRNHWGPAVLHSIPRVAHCEVLNVVVGSPQTIRTEWELKSAIVPLRFLVENADSLIPVEVGDSPLNGDSY